MGRFSAIFGHTRVISGLLLFAPLYLLGKVFSSYESVETAYIHYMFTRNISLVEERVKINGNDYCGEQCWMNDFLMPGLFLRSSIASLVCSIPQVIPDPPVHFKSFNDAFDHEYKLSRLGHIQYAVKSLFGAPSVVKEWLYPSLPVNKRILNVEHIPRRPYIDFDSNRASLARFCELINAVITIATVCFMEYQRAKRHLANSEDIKKALSQYVFNLVLDIATHWIAERVSLSVSDYFSNKVLRFFLSKDELENYTTYPYFSFLSSDLIYSLTQGIFSSFRKESYYLSEELAAISSES